MDNEDNVSPVLAPKRKEVPKEESMETTPVKTAAAAAGRTTPASSVAPKGKRKAGADESKSVPPASSKKVKAETTQEVKYYNSITRKTPNIPNHLDID